MKQKAIITLTLSLLVTSHYLYLIGRRADPSYTRIIVTSEIGRVYNLQAHLLVMYVSPINHCHVSIWLHREEF